MLSSLLGLPLTAVTVLGSTLIDGYYGQTRRWALEPKFRLVTSTDPTMFESRLGDFIASLARDDVIVDVKFSTSPTSNGVEYSALVHYQATEGWND